MRPNTQGFGSPAGAFTNGAAHPASLQQPGYGSAPLSGNDLQQSQINEFGGNPQALSPATPSRPPATAIAAGLTRPTNVK